MLIIAGFIILLFYRISKIKYKHRMMIIKYIIISLVISLVSLWFLQKEIFLHNGLDGTIGTDAYRYWVILKYAVTYKLSIKEFNDYIIFLGYPNIKFFFIFEYLVLITSVIKTPVILKICNIVLVQNIIVLVYLYIRSIDINLNKKYIKFILLLICTNGGLILTSIRVFKDIILLYILFESLYSLQIFFKKRSVIALITYFILAYFSNYIRPKSIYIYLFIFLVQIIIIKFSIMKSKKLKQKLVGILFIILISCIALYRIPFISELLNKTQEIAINDATNEISEGYGGYLSENTYILNNNNIFFRFGIGTLRTIFFPTPFKTLFTPVGYNVSFFEGITGRVLELMWQFVYPVSLIIFIYYILFYFSENDYKYIPYILFCLIQVLTYSFMYFGGAQLRWKLPYIILFIIFWGKCNQYFNRKDKILIFMINIVYFLGTYLWGVSYLL
ncbi:MULTISPECIES: hypothetical protein [Clostridium]|uniref:Glycosyltransferase RgtA/B/C/D-like domain-containing protein n=1 Tax=Clostridium lapidicellarium TaxID=3240931 RepID=A0ABV4DZL6_9CLOT